MAYVDSSTPGSTDPTQQNNPATAQLASGLNPALNQQPQTATAASSTSSPGSGAQGTSATPSASSAAPVQNLTDYLSVNAPQANQLAQGISQNLGNQYGQVMGDINNASSQFNNQVRASTVPFDASMLTSATSNPSQFVKDPNNVSQFQTGASGKYGGPSDFTQQGFYNGLNSEVTSAVQNAGNAQTPSGLQTLANSQERNPTPGESALDAMVLEGTPEAWQTVQTAAQPFQSLNNYLSGAQTSANQAASSAAATNQATGQQYKAGLNTAATGLTSQLNNEVQQAAANQKNYGDMLNSVTGKIQQNGINGLTPAQQRQYGVDPTLTALLTGVPTVVSGMNNAWNGLQQLNIPNLQDAFTIPTAPSEAPTSQTVGSQQEYETALALQQLSGDTSLGLPLSAATQGKAGSFSVPTALPSFNSKAGAQELFNALAPWQNLGPGPTPKGTNQFAADSDYISVMNSLASYLGLPPVSTNYPGANNPPPVTPPPTDPGQPHLGI